MDSELEALAVRKGWLPDVIAELQATVTRQTRGGQSTVFSSSSPDASTVAVEGGKAGTLRQLATIGDRYHDLGLLGSGGMGEVRRVLDRDLNRVMAMKTIGADLVEFDAAVARFVEEAQCSAQLQHPGIVPVHELGRLADGRVYFTMAEVRGRTLSAVVGDVHRASNDRWQPAADGWTFRRLIQTFLRVCEAVSYAHGRGVVHRDLKPANIMLGSHGEVLVVDWGLVKILKETGATAGRTAGEIVITDRSQDDAHATRVGRVAGTPAYMAPEQARGEIDAIDVRTDIYALGAILYEILSGRPPYIGASAQAVVNQVLSGPPEPLGSADDSGDTFSPWEVSAPSAKTRTGPPLPAALVAAAERAMCRDPDDRFAQTDALAAEVRAWLEGVRKREQALEVVERAVAKGPVARALRLEATTLRKQAAALLAAVAAWQPEQDKAPAWALEDQARDLEREATLADLEQEHLLAGSLTHVPDLPEAHAALAARYRAEHEEAEADRRDTTRSEVRLRIHAGALGADHPDRAGHIAYLSGQGTLTLHTEPPGAEVLLYRTEVRNRRRVEVFERSLGQTPVIEQELPRGSYLCEVRHPDHPPVRYPVWIGRGEHWQGVAPGTTESAPVRLRSADGLAQDDCFVPAGWFLSGGDPEAAESLPRRRLWCGDLVVKRFPVTNWEYIAFLDDLVKQGREKEALRHAPRERAGTAGAQGALIYGYTDGRFTLRPDADGDAWLPDFPVLMVDWSGAEAFADWTAARTGLPWRLPGELEWEKAARGVDGRRYPWGDVFDSSRCSSRGSRAGRPTPVVVDSFPIDVSPYGVRGMAGNVREWCADVYAADGPPTEDGRVLASQLDAESHANRVFRGGGWAGAVSFSRVANRFGLESYYRYNNLGFRIVRGAVSGAR
jgi:eukaryotic-like serine/threonine-protein kinase